MENHRLDVDAPDPDALPTAMVGIVGAILLIIAVVLLQGLYLGASRSELQRKVVDATPAELHDLQVAQLARLHRMGWVDKKNGFVSIPIERAMRLLVDDPKAAAPIIVPAPPGASP